MRTDFLFGHPCLPQYALARARTHSCARARVRIPSFPREANQRTAATAMQSKLPRDDGGIRARARARGSACHRRQTVCQNCGEPSPPAIIVRLFGARAARMRVRATLRVRFCAWHGMRAFIHRFARLCARGRVRLRFAGRRRSSKRFCRDCVCECPIACVSARQGRQLNGLREPVLSRLRV